MLWTRLRRIVVRVVSEFSTDGALSLAAAIAFYSALSLAPLALLVVAVAGRLWEVPTIQGEMLRQVDGLIGPEAGRLVQTVIERSGHPASGPAALLGLVVVAFGATSVFAQIQYALNRVWGVRVRKGFGLWRLLRTRLLSLGVILACGFLLLTALVVSSVVSFVVSHVRVHLPGSAFLWQAASLLGSMAVFTVLFATIFKLLPDVKITWRDVWTGAALTAVLLGLGKELIGLYLGRSGLGSAYGAASSLVLLLLWVYYASIILLVGAEFTQVWARLRGRGIAPKEYAEAI